ncbi:EscU/YscU/HrcU family type III secretion system export apparatus switch protein [Roseivivax sp. CAU 1761]
MSDDTEDKSSKTEEPTAQKLRKAREKGDVPSSKETGNLMSIFSLFMLVLLVLPSAAPDLARTLGAVIANASEIRVGVGDTGVSDLGGVVQGMALSVLMILAPAFATMVALAIFGVAIQGQVVVAAERIRPKLSKISPMAGLKRLFSKDTAIEFLKNLAKVAVVGVIGAWVAQGAVTQIWQGMLFAPETLPGYLRHEVSLILIGACGFLVPLTIFDIIWKRYQWREKQKMSLKEVRDEHKDSEGDPLIKRKRDQLRRQRAQQRLTLAVPTASVVLTNPTHYAVALRYDLGRDSAPVCVAKGTDLMAAQIRRIARENDVPMIENRPLARALHDAVELDRTIPAEHWKAVAEIIRYVMDLRADLKRRPPAGSSLREE